MALIVNIGTSMFALEMPINAQNENINTVCLRVQMSFHQQVY